jgi:hypothetical protein
MEGRCHGHDVDWRQEPDPTSTSGSHRTSVTKSLPMPIDPGSSGSRTSNVFSHGHRAA